MKKYGEIWNVKENKREIWNVKEDKQARRSVSVGDMCISNHSRFCVQDF